MAWDHAALAAELEAMGFGADLSSAAVAATRGEGMQDPNRTRGIFEGAVDSPCRPCSEDGSGHGRDLMQSLRPEIKQQMAQDRDRRASPSSFRRGSALAASAAK